MKKLIESARRATEAAQEEIAKLRERIHPDQHDYEKVDDAYLGIGWVVERLKEFDAANPPSA